MKKFNKFFRWNGGLKKLIILAIVMIASLFLLQRLMEVSRNVVTLTYSRFLNAIDTGKVRTIYVEGQEVRGFLTDNTLFQVIVPETGVDWANLRAHGIDFSVANMAEYSYNWYIFYAILFVALCSV